MSQRDKAPIQWDEDMGSVLALKLHAIVPFLYGSDLKQIRLISKDYYYACGDESVTQHIFSVYTQWLHDRSRASPDFLKSLTALGHLYYLGNEWGLKDCVKANTRVKTMQIDLRDGSQASQHSDNEVEFDVTDDSEKAWYPLTTLELTALRVTFAGSPDTRANSAIGLISNLPNNLIRLDLQEVTLTSCTLLPLIGKTCPKLEYLSLLGVTFEMDDQPIFPLVGFTCLKSFHFKCLGAEIWAPQHISQRGALCLPELHEHLRDVILSCHMTEVELEIPANCERLKLTNSCASTIGRFFDHQRRLTALGAGTLRHLELINIGEEEGNLCVDLSNLYLCELYVVSCWIVQIFPPQCCSDVLCIDGGLGSWRRPSGPWGPGTSLRELDYLFSRSRCPRNVFFNRFQETYELDLASCPKLSTLHLKELEMPFITLPSRMESLKVYRTQFHNTEACCWPDHLSLWFESTSNADVRSKIKFIRAIDVNASDFQSFEPVVGLESLMIHRRYEDKADSLLDFCSMDSFVLGRYNSRSIPRSNAVVNRPFPKPQRRRSLIEDRPKTHKFHAMSVTKWQIIAPTLRFLSMEQIHIEYALDLQWFKQLETLRCHRTVFDVLKVPSHHAIRLHLEGCSIGEMITSP